MLPIKGASLLVCLSVYLFFLLPDYGFLRRAAMGCGWRYFSSRLCSSRIHCLWKTILQGQSWHGKRNVQVSNTYRQGKQVFIHSWSKIHLFGLDPNSLLFGPIIKAPIQGGHLPSKFESRYSFWIKYFLHFVSKCAFLHQNIHFWIENFFCQNVDFWIKSPLWYPKSPLWDPKSTFVSKYWLLNQTPTLGSKIHFGKYTFVSKLGSKIHFFVSRSRWKKYTFESNSRSNFSYLL